MNINKPWKIGLEIHISVLSKRKSFSYTPINGISWTSLGLIGTLPSINFEAIKKSIQLANALKMKINHENITFDRKNYFYYDLPRGYQITQFFNPIGQDGYIELENKKKIRIKQLHLEEDTAKQIKHGHDISLFFERLGSPLIEVVTESDFTDFSEIKEFLHTLISMCVFLDISNCKFEDGEIRIDVNISLQLTETTTTPKSEIKNLNSISAIEEIIKFQTNHLMSQLKKQEEINSFTYVWIEKLKVCKVLREKKKSLEYFYIPEANIPRIHITKEEVKKLLSEKPNFLNFIKELKKSGLSSKEIHHLMTNYEIFQHVSEVNECLKNWKKSFLWIAVVAMGIINNSKQKDINFEEIKKLIILLEKKKDTNQQNSKKMIKFIIETNATAKDAFKKYQIQEISDKDSLLKLMNEILDENEDQLIKLSQNLPKFEKFLVGLSLKKSEGKVKPQAMSEIFKKNIKKYLKSKKINLVIK